MLSNSEVSILLLKLQPFRVVKYSLPFYCIWLTDKRPKKGCEEICICLVLAELLHFKLKSGISFSFSFTETLTYCTCTSFAWCVMANSVFHVMRDGPKKVSVMRDRHPPNLVCYHGNLRSNKLFLGNKKKLRYCRLLSRKNNIKFDI